MQFPEIPQVGREGTAYELAREVWRNEVPGFQDFNGCDLPRYRYVGYVLDLVVELEEASRDAIAELEPEERAQTDEEVLFTKCGYFPRSFKTAPHLDGHLRGLAAHLNGTDGGHAELAWTREQQAMGYKERDWRESGQFSQGYTGAGMRAQHIQSRLHGIHAGPLRARGITVFSEGNVPGLEPTVHYFARPAELQSSPFIRLSAPYEPDGLPDGVSLPERRSNFVGRLLTADCTMAYAEAAERLAQDPRGFDSEVRDLQRLPSAYCTSAAYGEEHGALWYRLLTRPERQARRELAAARLTQTIAANGDRIYWQDIE